jgi:hypothetical protein
LDADTLFDFDKATLRPARPVVERQSCRKQQARHSPGLALRAVGCNEVRPDLGFFYNVKVINGAIHSNA